MKCTQSIFLPDDELARVVNRTENFLLVLLPINTIIETSDPSVTLYDDFANFTTTAKTNKLEQVIQNNSITNCQYFV